ERKAHSPPQRQGTATDRGDRPECRVLRVEKLLGRRQVVPFGAEGLGGLFFLLSAERAPHASQVNDTRAAAISCWRRRDALGERRRVGGFIVVVIGSPLSWAQTRTDSHTP